MEKNAICSDSSSGGFCWQSQVLKNIYMIHFRNIYHCMWAFSDVQYTRLLTFAFILRVSFGVRLSALASTGTMLTFWSRAFIKLTSIGLRLRRHKGNLLIEHGLYFHGYWNPGIEINTKTPVLRRGLTHGHEVKWSTDSSALCCLLCFYGSARSHFCGTSPSPDLHNELRPSSCKKNHV